MFKKITATPANPAVISFRGNEYQFTTSTTATRAATVAELIEQQEAVQADNRYMLAALLHETTLTGKLEGLKSITTSCTDCNFCAKMHNTPGTICTKCYSEKMLSTPMRRALREHAVINGFILKNVDLTPDHWKAAPVAMFQSFHRIESHGETENATQAQNYINLCIARPQTVFGIWTKQPKLYTRIFEQNQKPDNLRFVISSPFVNTPAKIDPDCLKWVDHLFTVYDEARQLPKNATPCGMKCSDCIEAGKACYFQHSPDNPRDIAERLK